MNSLSRFLAALAIAGALLCGCGNQGSPSVEQLATPPATADQKLLADLRALPPEARPDYLQKHPDVARELSNSADPSVKSAFTRVMHEVP